MAYSNGVFKFRWLTDPVDPDGDGQEQLFFSFRPVINTLVAIDDLMPHASTCCM